MARLKLILKAFRLEAQRVILGGDPAPVILGTGGILVLVGFWMMLPFDSFLASPSYAYLRSLPIGEFTYGLAFFVLGLGKWGLLAYNSLPLICAHTFAPSPHALFAACALNGLMGVVWFNLTVGVVFGNAEAFGWIVYLGLSLASFWATARRFRQGRSVLLQRGLEETGRL